MDILRLTISLSLDCACRSSLLVSRMSRSLGAASVLTFNFFRNLSSKERRDCISR